MLFDVEDGGLEWEVICYGNGFQDRLHRLRFSGSFTEGIMGPVVGRSLFRYGYIRGLAFIFGMASPFGYIY